MSTRAFVARINGNGTGLYVCLGRNGYPHTPGQIPPSAMTADNVISHTHRKSQLPKNALTVRFTSGHDQLVIY